MVVPLSGQRGSRLTSAYRRLVTVHEGLFNRGEVNGVPTKIILKQYFLDTEDTPGRVVGREIGIDILIWKGEINHNWFNHTV